MPKKNEPKPAETFKNRHISKALAESRPAIDSAMLLSDLIDVWGGTRQVALDIRNEFQGAAKGGMTRQRILEMFQRLIITNTTQEIGRVREPSDLTDADLETELMSFMTKVTDVARPSSPPECPEE